MGDLIAIDDMDGNELSVDPDLLKSAFISLPETYEFDPKAFSVHDLWFWTI